MALLFQLEADCVSDDAARSFGRHFAGLSFSLPDGRVCRIDESDVSVFTDAHGHARCYVLCLGASFTGAPQVLDTDDERKEFILYLYDHLRKAPPFRFAAAGLECHDFDPWDLQGRLFPMEGLVICDLIFVESGSPTAFQPFSAGYHWIPFTRQTRIL